MKKLLRNSPGALAQVGAQEPEAALCLTSIEEKSGEGIFMLNSETENGKGVQGILSWSYKF